MELRVDEIACERGGRLLFSGLSFGLGPGELLALTGPNGAGKTSLLRLIAGLAEPQSGTIELEGRHQDLTVGQHSHLIAHREAIKLGLTVRENLEFWSDYLGGGDIGAALVSFDLGSLADYPAQLLSAGQRRRLALSRLCLVKRVMWLLDEPTTGLDARSQDRLASAIGAHLAEGGLAIAATHGAIGLEPHRKLHLEQRP
ncbi:MAG: heme ABC exporter ATP-binding protein CcmA [Rhizobiales bacterium]|nr:heme ABC exporter ATP-binding protein CcmA [Hyphomicrobiales bacterium]